MGAQQPYGRLMGGEAASPKKEGKSIFAPSSVCFGDGGRQLTAAVSEGACV